MTSGRSEWGELRSWSRLIPGVTSDIQIPTDGNSYPTLTVHWDEKPVRAHGSGV